MPTKKNPRSSKDKSISINGDVRDSTVIIGDNNTVSKTTIIQKFFNIFKSDAETLEQRNRRILLNHVENAWIKGVLDASLYGAAMLDLGIKETPEAITNKYPWTLKKESTNETLPAGTSMLEIFDSIGMGRSLLILGAPGSGKTTMLLELARGLIARAREDVTHSIPMVFNLASWTEKLSLANWLAQELNNLYSVPRKTAPDWVKGNKLLLLLDGLDEVRQESRAKCVEAINEFRKQNGLTSLAVCSRSQDYADLKAKLSFEGAIEVQPLTQEQIIQFLNRFGEEMAGTKQVLNKDGTLREMAETPLFLSIMVMAYRDKRDVEILVSGDEKARRKHLFDTYIERMFVRRSENKAFKKQYVLPRLSWLAKQMKEYNETPYFLENMQPNWLNPYEKRNYRMLLVFVVASLFSFVFGIVPRYVIWCFSRLIFSISIMIDNSNGVLFGAITGILLGIVISHKEIKMTDRLIFSLKRAVYGVTIGAIVGLIVFLSLESHRILLLSSSGLTIGLFIQPSLGALFTAILGGIFGGLTSKYGEKISYPSQRLTYSLKNFLLVLILFGAGFGILTGWIFEIYNTVLQRLFLGITWGPAIGLVLGFAGAFFSGGGTLIQHYTLRFILARNNFLPWRLIPFLNHCVDLIFLRRVGGGYIFVHRLLMEHFAEMYVETTK